MRAEGIDAAAAAYGRMFETVAAGAAGGWSRHAEGLSTMVTGFDDPMLNAVLAVGPDVDDAAVAAALAEVATSGLPHCLETRHSSGADIARRREMVAAAEVPFMVFDDGTALPDGAPSGLEIRPLAAGEIDLHLDCLAAAVTAPAGYFEPFGSGTLLHQEGVTAYVGQAGDEVVCTGIALLVDGFVGVINMGTPARHRGRGYAAAVAERIVCDGLAAGARAAVLQPSALGFPVYERLGFRTVEQWTVWLPPES